MGKYSKEDLRALLEYISSNPAIPFPNLTKKEREELIKDVLNQLEELKEKELNPKLVIDVMKSTAINLKIRKL